MKVYLCPIYLPLYPLPLPLRSLFIYGFHPLCPHGLQPALGSVTPPPPQRGEEIDLESRRLKVVPGHQLFTPAAEVSHRIQLGPEPGRFLTLMFTSKGGWVGGR